MGKLRCLLLTLIYQAFFGFTAFSGTLPHTFVAGQTASASQVNENFRYLLNQVGMKKVYADGELIGTTSVTRYQTSLNYLIVFNTSGFSYYLKIDGTIMEDILYFKTDNCEETPYMAIGNPDNIFFNNVYGRIFHNSGQVYYAKGNETKYQFQSNSYKYMGVCKASTSNKVFVEAIPNTPSITAISNYPLITPIRIEGMEISEVTVE